MPVTRYTVRIADPVQDRDTVLALWQQAFPTPDKHPIKYDWCYGALSEGPGRLYLLEDAEDSCVVGVQGIIRRRWWSQGKVRDNGIFADLVVDQNRRSIGPALALVRQVVELEQHSKGVCFLYGFPNNKSEALYRRAGYSKMGEMTRYSRPLRLHVWFIRKGIPTPLALVLGKIADLALQVRLLLRQPRSARRWRCLSATQFDTRFDALWSRVAPHAAPMVMRNSDYLQWRFGNNFTGPTQVMVLESGNKQIDAYVVYTVTDNNMVTVQDFLAIDDADALPAMLTLFARAMFRQGHAGIMLEFSGPAKISDAFRCSGFFPRESQPIYAVLRQNEICWREGNVPYFTSSDRDQ